eukprot:1186511-Amorphochlora_amoeboformis.AAC.2
MRTATFSRRILQIDGFFARRGFYSSNHFPNVKTIEKGGFEERKIEKKISPKNDTLAHSRENPPFQGILQERAQRASPSSGI